MPFELIRTERLILRPWLCHRGRSSLIHYLYTDFGVTRIESSLHPDIPSSARVLEACGLVFEGQTRRSFWVGDECSDDMLYGMTRADWEAWCHRPRHRPDQVELLPITSDIRRTVGDLVTHKSQERFVAPVLESFRDALIPPSRDGGTLVPWYRAISADGEIVGFVMALEMTEHHANPYLWRLLIDRAQQRRGIGTVALEKFEQRCRFHGANAIDASWQKLNHSQPALRSPTQTSHATCAAFVGDKNFVPPCRTPRGAFDQDS